MKSFSILSRLSVALPLVAGSLSPVISAADYLGEISASGVHINADARTSTDTYRLDATVYLQRVSTEDVPLKEAAFLGRNSSISVGYFDSEKETPSTKEDSDGWSLGTRQIIFDQWILGANYVQADIEGVDQDSYGTQLGLYLNDTTAITLNGLWIDNEQDSEVRDSYALAIQTVVETYAGNKVNGEGYVSQGATLGGGSEISLGGNFDYYLNNNWSIGAGFDLTLPNGIKPDANTYSFRTDYFITESIAVGAGFALTVFQEQDTESDFDNTETFEVSITGRI